MDWYLILCLWLFQIVCYYVILKYFRCTHIPGPATDSWTNIDRIVTLSFSLTFLGIIIIFISYICRRDEDRYKDTLLYRPFNGKVAAWFNKEVSW